MIRVIIKEPGKAAQIKEIENTLETFQEIVSGYIETFEIGARMSLVCNEEGKLRKLQPNFKCANDVIVGTVILTTHNDEGDFIDLSDNQIEFLFNCLKLNSVPNLRLMGMSL